MTFLHTCNIPSPLVHSSNEAKKMGHKAVET